MTRAQPAGDRREQAISWFVRLQSADDDVAWLAHRDWLEADPENAAAFAAVERLWVDADHLAGMTPVHKIAVAAKDRSEASVSDLAERSSISRQRRTFWLPAALAASVALIFGLWTGRPGPSQALIYSADQQRAVTLADGSRLTLERGTQLRVRLDRRQRMVSLVSGRAAFNVRHDAERPFIVTAQNRHVRVLGTEFDVMARDEAFVVSVRRGLVSVSSGDAVVRLTSGYALVRLPGSTRDRVRSVNPANALGWRDGRLFYVDGRLADVASDYERFVGLPVTVSPSLRGLQISGTLRIRDEDDLVRQLELLLPIRVVKATDSRQIVKR